MVSPNEVDITLTVRQLTRHVMSPQLPIGLPLAASNDDDEQVRRLHTGQSTASELTCGHEPDFVGRLTRTEVVN